MSFGAGKQQCGGGGDRGGGQRPCECGPNARAATAGENDSADPTMITPTERRNAGWNDPAAARAGVMVRAEMASQC